MEGVLRRTTAKIIRHADAGFTGVGHQRRH
jgi:hypothetical protein